MSDDTELLRRYVRERSEAAFTELVQRHLNLVYAAALRLAGGDSALAEDLTQAVFVELARKAPRLVRHPTLAGWLYTSVRHVSANVRRAETRRQRREEVALAMNESSSPDSPEAAWFQIRPLIDDAMHELSETDRTAVVLRFFQERNLREVGEALGLSENAARMRVDRALDKLRALLGRRGITSTTSGLTAALAAGAVLQAPPALAATVATTALAGMASVTSTTLKIMSMTKLKAGLVGTLAVVGVAVPVWQEARVRQLTSENAELRVQTARIPALEARLTSLSKLDADANELAQMRSDQEKMKLEVARLRNMAGAARRAESEMAQLRQQLMRRQTETGTNHDAGPMGDLMRSALAQQSKGQLSRMQAKLDLTPGQAEAIQRILDRQTQVISKSMQKAFAGKLGQEDMAELRRDSFDPETEIKALLSPEQLALYQEYKQDEAVGQARLAANAEMLQMQGSLGLSPEQQDQVFSVLYDATLRQMQDGPGGAKNGDPAEVLQSMLEQKVMALEGVLTAEQLQSYRQAQETQIQFLKTFLPQTGSNPGGS